MNPEGNPESATTPEETAAILKRILAAVEKDKSNRWAEITCAVVLSLATMASAWCAYQSTLWGGVQTFRLAAANKAGREASAANLAALQYRAFDATMFIHFVNAKLDGNEVREKFFLSRFRPQMKKAVEAWLATDPFNDPKAPLAPFKMAEYAQQEQDPAQTLEDRSALEHSAAERANVNSDTYVLLTVLFATVLFFGGIAGTVDSRRLRVIILVVALALFVVTLAFLATMPICKE